MLLLAMAPWVVSSQHAHALELVDGVVRDIDATTALNRYQIINGGALNANGATTNGILVEAGSSANITGGQVNGAALGALRVVNAQATLESTRIINTAGGGLFASRNNATSTGSTVMVNRSVIQGTTLGASASGFSRLTMTDSAVAGTAAGSSGLSLTGGQALLKGSSITGVAQGVVMRVDTSATGQKPTLELDSSSVEGAQGPAILVRGGADALISLRNGSSLTGLDGSILEVAQNSSATMVIEKSGVSGNVLIESASRADLVLDQASMSGNINAQSGAAATVTLNRNSQFTGQLNNVQQVNINSNSNWTLDADNTVANLAMNGGQVTFSDNATFYRLNVENLSGNGTFVMASDFANGDTDFLNVTGNASGNHGLLIGSNGADPSLQSLKVVHVAAGDAQFSLLNEGERVDLGAYSYQLVQKDDQDWYLDQETRTISPMTRAVMALFNTPITIAYGEMTSLRSRMGELRYNQGKNAGVWMRAYGNQHNIADASSGVGYQQNQRGLTFGADAQLGDSNWTLGLLAGHSRSDLNLSYGTSGSVDSYYVGGYATWMDLESGYYVDSVLKYNRYQNNAKVGLSDGTRTKGDYDTHGVSASVEAGRHIKLNDGYFIEPFAQVATAAVAGKDFTLDNGFDANGDVSRSLLGKVGTTVGKTISLGGDSMIQPYVKAAFAHEFAQRNQVQVNNNVFNNDLSGSRAELGAGVAWTVAKDFQVYSEAGYMNGKHIEMPYSFSLGASYRF